MSRTKGSKNKPRGYKSLLNNGISLAEISIVGVMADQDRKIDMKVNRLTALVAVVALATALSLLSIFLHFSRVLEIVIK